MRTWEILVGVSVTGRRRRVDTNSLRLHGSECLVRLAEATYCAPVRAFLMQAPGMRTMWTMYVP